LSNKTQIVHRWVVRALVWTMVVAAVCVSVPFLQHWRAKSQTVTCISRAKAVAAAIRNYAMNWDGWTHRGPDGYVKMAGQKLKGEEGYNPKVAAEAEDFRCPADRSPRRNLHGYFSSYRVLDEIFGPGVMPLGDPPYLLLYEKGRRHPREGRLEAVYVFTDGSAQLGYDKVLPGLGVKAWKADTVAWEAAKGDGPSPRPDYDDDWWDALDQWCYDYSWQEFRPSRPAGARDAVHPARARTPRPVLVRFDGLLLFPTDGDWKLRIKGESRAYLWLDIDQDGEPNGAEEASHPGGSGGPESTHECPGMRAKTDYALKFLLHLKGADEMPRLWWVDPDGREESIQSWYFRHRLN